MEEEKYHVNEPEGKVRISESCSERKVESSEGKVESSERKVESSEGKVESSGQTKKRLSFEDLQAQIITIAQDYVTMEEIAINTQKKLQYLVNKIIPRMLQAGTIERLYPGVPSHPKQKYKATNKNHK